MKVQRQVELIALGDELLTGARQNAHLAYLGERLGDHGLPIRRACEVRDEPDDIRETFLAAWRRADLVVTTGGLGPTNDDLTRETIAAALGRGLVRDEAVAQHIRAWFARRGIEPPANNFRQALIIEGAEALPNSNGTAPGQWLVDDGRLLVMLPGPATEMRAMFEEQVLPRLQTLGWALAAQGCLLIRTMGVGESMVAELVEPVFTPWRDRLRVAYCAHQGVVDLRLSAIDERLTAAELRLIGEACRERLGCGFVSFGSPDVACLILHQLRRLGKTLAVAESCTGGLLAGRFTDSAGSSKVFMGGVVCYRNEVKESLLDIPGCLLEQHGAVSAECAVAMATAAAEKLEADYALSVTGYAGPEGGREPAGTVYIGYHSPVGVWAHKTVLAGNRPQVRERAVNAALDLIRRKLRKYEMFDLLDSMKC
jgi:nicotinamide-nucleotide amidase